MAITTETLINHYKIIALLGAGGMGEVYKAHDTTLDRSVALKILPSHLIADADRVRRFIQEAKSASALNHPHIVTIYEIGQARAEDASDPDLAGLIHYIAMEFVDGGTLHSKIHREKADLRMVIQYLAQAADGLAKAHNAGIVHRDLKPENIMITDDGYAKILDFGLAKLIEASAAAPAGDTLEDAATAMMNQTRPGMVMGTVGYMSPEQVQGKPVDQRSDIFSFGCILYEAATGLKPFAGDSLIDSLHKIVYAQAPPIRDANPNAPVELQRIIRKCLAKNPNERYQSIKDVALDLREMMREYDTLPLVSGMYPQPVSSGAYSDPQITAPQPQPSLTGAQSQSAITGPQQSLATDSGQSVTLAPLVKKKRWIIYGAGLAVVAVAAAVLLYVYIGQKQVKKRGMPLFQNPKISKLTSTGKSQGGVISPDGKYVAHIISEAGQPSLWIKQLATSSNERKIAPADVRYGDLSFSPDSNYIYYTSAERSSNIMTLYQVPVVGSTPKKVLDDVDSAVTFSPDGKRMAFVRNSSQVHDSALIVVNSDGSGEQKLVVRKQPDIYIEPKWSPDGSVIACSVRSLAGGFHMEAVEIRVADGTEKPIGSQRWGAILGLDWLYDGSGLIISGRDQSPGMLQLQLWMLAYPGGQVRRITNDLNNYAGVSLSADSTALVTLQADAVCNVWTVPGSDVNRAQQITSGSGKNIHAKWTPDGRIVYVSDASGNLDIWIMNSDGKNQRQLTDNPGIDTAPSVSPDGRHIVYCSTRATGTGAFSIWRMGIDGSNPKQLTSGEADLWPIFSSDGKWVVYNSLTNMEKPVLWKVPVDGGEPVKATEAFSLQAAYSPDGKYIATWHNPDQANPRMKLAIIPVEGGEPTKLFDAPPSVGEFVNIRWAADGKAILYLDSREGIPNVWSQPIGGSPPKQVTSFKSDLIFNFDLSRDGKQLICSRGVSTVDVILIRDEERLEARR